MTTEMRITDANRKGLAAYAWPGGYPIMYLAKDGWREDNDRLEENSYDQGENVCCAKCAADTEGQPDLIIIAEYVHWEGSAEYCEYCDGLTESAYGDPDPEKEESGL